MALGSAYIPPGHALGDARVRQEATADQSRQLGVRQIQAVPLTPMFQGCRKSPGVSLLPEWLKARFMLTPHPL